MGGVDYIYKPVNAELLRAKVGVFVELYRKNRQLIVHEKKLLTANKSLQKEIEERKISEEKIKALNKQLIANNAHLLAINEELDRFAYVASHDLQEPLRKIMVFSDKILSKQDNPAEVEKYLQKIVGSSQRMQSLIKDLLQFSRQTIHTDDFVNVNLNELVKEAMLELEIEIEKNNAQITIDDLPVIWAIPPLMRQLFYNLISNAIKFRKKDTVLAITISAEKIKNHLDATYYRLSVSDNGIGFDPAYAGDIFVIFKRLHSYHEYQGSGVGLSICKKIVDKHNGFIRAIGKPGDGATFVIELPQYHLLS